MKYALIIIAALIGFYLFSIIFASFCAVVITFRRGSKKKWARESTDRIDEKKEMYEFGVEWRKRNLDRMTEVSVKNKGLNLYGEYYDFGYNKCVIILLGRSECFYDSFYFASPYINSGFNLLAMDSRAHGLSDGKYHTFGYEESLDCIEWAKFLHERYNIEHIVLHGICAGASAGLFALVSDDCPDYIEGLVGEGMHTRVFETIKNHLIERRKPVYPTINFMGLWLKLFTSHSIVKGPIDVIGEYKKPLLMLHSEKDEFSLPELAKKIFSECSSAEKKLVIFEEGEHSLVRIHNTEKYDEEIEKFLTRIYSDATVIG